MPATTEATILERLFEPDEGEMSPEAARYFLSRDLQPPDRRRLEELAAKAEQGPLTPAEQAELDTYRRVSEALARLQAKARQALEHQARPEPSFEVPAGIRRSQEALHRDLPELLQDERLQGQWVAYHGDQRIGIAPTQRELIHECLRRGLQDDTYYVGAIDPTELIEEEDIEDRSFSTVEEIEGPLQHPES